MLVFSMIVQLLSVKQAAVHADGNMDWQAAGSLGISAGTAYNTSIVTDSSGTPYMVYIDGGNGNKTTVMKYDGSSWMPVGSAGFSLASASNASIAIDSSGTLYVGYATGGGMMGNGSMTVMKYNGSNWEAVGSADFADGGDQYTKIAIDSSGTPYVVFNDNENGEKATVVKYDGNNWVTVGSAGFTGGADYYTAIAIDGNGIPYVAYMDGGNGSKATVMKYNGSSWAAVGTAGFSAAAANYPSIAIDSSGTPYVVYGDSANASKATVMKYSGGSWAAVGTPGFSAGQADYTSIAVDNGGTPYVVYKDYGNNYSATVMKYDGSNWATVGSAGFTGDTAGFTSIAITSSGTLYVVYQDRGANYKASAMKVATPSYTVTYDGNGSTGGTVPADSRSYVPNAPVTVAGNTGNLVKTGYTFAGWNTAEDGSGTSYSGGATFAIGSANMTLYAKWTTGGSVDNVGVSLNATKYTLPVSGTYKSVLRSNASDNSSAPIASGVKFESSNPAVATVDETSGLVTGVAKGTVTISTYYVSGGTEYRRYATVTVDPKAPAYVEASAKKAGAIYLSVVDPSGAAVEGATVKIAQGSKVYPLATTDGNGRVLKYVPAGSYTVTVYAPNGTTLKNYTVKGLKVLAGQRSEPFVKQQLAAGAVSLTVNAIAGADKVITGTAPTGSTVTARVGSTTVGTAKGDKEGKFTIKLKTPQPGKTVIVTAVDADESEKTVSMDVPKAAAVTLTAATKNNTVDKDIVITFKDTIGLLPTTVTAVTYNGEPMAKGTAYTIAKGKLTIKKGTFATPGSYPLVVQSSAYEDSSVTQTIVASSGKK